MKGFRTFFHVSWISIAGVVLTAKDELAAAGVDLKAVLPDFLPAKFVGLGMIAIAFLFAYCRLITTTPPFKGE